ncbi:beta-glucosidase [Cryptococcus deuterogattii CA1014]|nr:beta-glucosidase [Cryptococcus deuterogattii CA1014]
MVALPFTLLWLSTGFSLTYASPFKSNADNSTISATEAKSDNSTVSFPHNVSRHHESSSQSAITYISPEIEAPINVSYIHHSHKWEKAHRRAKRYLADWTLEEKVQLTTGVGWQNGRCLGNIGPIPSKNFPGLCLQDSPLGVRLTDFVSAFPAGINAAATFDKDLIYARGYAMGQEFKGKGANVALGPMTNMGRVAAGGRNWEGFGGDPYLSGWATEMTIRGIQDAGVQACVKHYVGNEQERNRTTESSNIDDRTLREIYTHPFLRAVQADVASVMCSYNLINGSWACQNSKTLNSLLKTDFGFQGYVVSDWGAQHSGVVSANTGLDMSMPGDIVLGSLTSYWGSNLTESVKNGSVSEERLDDMVERIIAAYFLLDQDKDYPEVNFDSFRLSGSNNSHVDVQDDHWKIIRKIGASSTVLLKNVDHALPLWKPRSMTLIGSDLGPSLFGPNGFPDRGGLSGTLAMGWGSGTAQFPYLVDPLSAISLQARKDGTTLNWWLDNWNLSEAAYWASVAEVAIVGINSDSGEGYITVDNNEGDRNNLTAWNNGDELVKAVASANNNTIVIVHSVGPIIIESWIDHPNITAVLWAGLPGQESGNSLVDVLYGAYNPSARLPYTIAKRREDYSADIDYVTSDVPAIPQVNYTEGLFIDYRHFLAKNITPRYEFGFGMSYTSFEFGDVSVEEIKKEGAENDIFHFRDVDDHGTVKAGRFLLDYLHKARWTVTVDITNTGEVNGCEVPQLYLAYPADSGEPPKVLRDFARINLDPGASQRVTFNLSRYDVSIWDVVHQKWTIPNGTFGVEVGKSSMDKDAKKASFCPGSY